MKKAMFFVVLFTICNLALLSCADDISPSGDEISSEEYKVYSDALQQLTIKLPETRNLVICDHTSTDPVGPFLNQERVDEFEKVSGRKLDKDLVRKFQNKNEKSYKLENKFTNALNMDRDYVVLISKGEIEHIFKNGKKVGWDRFYKKYPNSHGRIWVSRVAFNDDENIAFFHSGSIYGPRAGVGYDVLLKKKIVNG